MTSEDATLQGFVIPKNTIVFGNLFACAMDPNVWSNVNDFKPERHLDDNGHFHNNVKHIPFSIGTCFIVSYLYILIEMSTYCLRDQATNHGFLNE